MTWSGKELVRLVNSSPPNEQGAQLRLEVLHRDAAAGRKAATWNRADQHPET